MQMRIEQKATKTTKKTGPFDSALGFFSLLLILLPATFGVLYVHTFGVSVVDSDSWSVVPLFDKWYSASVRPLEPTQHAPLVIPQYRICLVGRAYRVQ